MVMAYRKVLDSAKTLGILGLPRHRPILRVLVNEYKAITDLPRVYRPKHTRLYTFFLMSSLCSHKIVNPVIIPKP